MKLALRSLFLPLLAAVGFFGIGLLMGALWSPRFEDPNQAPTPQRAPEQSRVVADGRTIDAPPGSTVEFWTKDTTRGGLRTENATAKAADIRSSSGDISSKLRTSAPELTSGPSGTGVKGVGSEFSLALTGKNDANVFYLMAAICLLGAGLLFYFGQRKAAIIAAVCAGGLVATGVLITTYPWAILILVGVGAVGLGYWIWTERKNMHLTTALSTVTSAVSGLDAEDKGTVKDAVAAQAKTEGTTKIVDKTIAKVKAQI